MNRKRRRQNFCRQRLQAQKHSHRSNSRGVSAFSFFYAGVVAESADKSVFNVTELLAAAADGGKIAVAAGFGQTVQNLCKTLVKYAECDAVAQ